MGNLTVAMVFVLVLNVLMWTCQASIMQLNTVNPTVFYTDENKQGSLIGEFDKNAGTGNDPILDTDNLNNQLPSSEGSISPTTGNIFVDIFTSVKNWFVDTTHLDFVYNILSAPYHILKAMHLPEELSFTFGTLWYALTLFLVVSFLWGRDT